VPVAPVVRSRVMSRDVPRGAGRWAIASGGRSKSKSETFTGGIVASRAVRTGAP